MLQRFADLLLYWDYNTWYYINVVWHNNALDVIAPYFQNQWLWAPAYLFLVVFMLYNFNRKGLYWCAGFISCFVLGEVVSRYVLQPIFGRTGPCNNAYLQMLMHPVAGCTPGYSFPSAVATANFAIVFFLFHTLPKKLKWIGYTATVWAIAIAYCQVYVSVNFPSDELCGALTGAITGVLLGRLYSHSYTLTAA